MNLGSYPPDHYTWDKIDPEDILFLHIHKVKGYFEKKLPIYVKSTDSFETKKLEKYWLFSKFGPGVVDLVSLNRRDHNTGFHAVKVFKSGTIILQGDNLFGQKIYRNKSLVSVFFRGPTDLKKRELHGAFYRVDYIFDIRNIDGNWYAYKDTNEVTIYGSTVGEPRFYKGTYKGRPRHGSFTIQKEQPGDLQQDAQREAGSTTGDPEAGTSGDQGETG